MTRKKILQEPIRGAVIAKNDLSYRAQTTDKMRLETTDEAMPTVIRGQKRPHADYRQSCANIAIAIAIDYMGNKNGIA